MIKNEQLSSVYGLYFVGDGDERLLGVYTSEEEARKALEDILEKEASMEEYVNCMQDYAVHALSLNQEANWWYLNGPFRYQH